MRLAYLFSRYPVVSQTFCDTEILALERMGVDLEIYSIYAPPTSFRHGHAARMRASIHYAPPQEILKLHEQAAKAQGRWPEKLIADHDHRFGKDYKSALRARNALYFADLFKARGITHFHVHFANRAAHTAIFVKAISGIPFSISTHGQDFMSDLGNDDLLREICKEAEFIANETEFSKGLVAARAPESEPKMLRVFNGMDLGNFRDVAPDPQNEVPRIISTGRLIEFKGFHHLIAACADLRDRGCRFTCEIVGEGPWRQKLQAKIDELRLEEIVQLLGTRPQEEVFARLQAADIFALACIVDQVGASDVFPTVILEAMASAKPVVSTTLAGVPESVISGTTGLLVPPGDERALADALEQLIRSPELRRQYGNAGRHRIETEFGVDTTVLPLKAQFARFVKPAPAPATSPAGLAVLLDAWPAADRINLEIQQLQAAFPAAHTYALHASNRQTPKGWEQGLWRIDFLPDGMVIEGEWQQQRGLARQMETWRVDLGQKLSSEAFLQHARYALYLKTWVERHGVTHLQAETSRELLATWLLARLCGITFSANIEETDLALPRSLIQRLVADAVGVRVEEKAFFQQLTGALSNVTVVRGRPGRSLDANWQQMLQNWSQPRPA